MIEPIDRHEAIDSSDPADAIEPTDSTEPTEPIDRTEPLEAIDRTESSDHSDHLLVSSSAAIERDVKADLSRAAHKSVAVVGRICPVRASLARSWQGSSHLLGLVYLISTATHLATALGH
jgi:hypothetical protein